MVPKAGLEPARPCGQQILSLLRLPIPSFGQLAESVGFEPTDACTSSDFKSDAINRTLPTLHMAGAEGIEPSKCDSQSVVPYRLATPQCIK